MKQNSNGDTTSSQDPDPTQDALDNAKVPSTVRDSELGNLYSISRELYDLETALIEGQGQLTQELEDRLSYVNIAREKKVDAYFAIIQRCKSLESEYKAKAEMFSSIASSAKNTAAKLKKSLKEAMQFLGVKDLEGKDVRFKVTEPTTKVVITDQGIVPIAYFTQRTVLEPNMDAIRDSWANGMPVPGTSLIETQQLRSYPMRKIK